MCVELRFCDVVTVLWRRTGDAVFSKCHGNSYSGVMDCYRQAWRAPSQALVLALLVAVCSNKIPRGARSSPGFAFGDFEGRRFWHIRGILLVVVCCCGYLVSTFSGVFRLLSKY